MARAGARRVTLLRAKQLRRSRRRIRAAHGRSAALLPLSRVSWLYATIGGRASTATPAPKELSMPPAKNSTSRSSHPTTFKEPAALKWLSSSLDTAQQALVELREHTGRDVSQGARELHKELRAFISSARRDSGKLANGPPRDSAHAQKRLSCSFGGDFAVAATRKPCYQVSSRPQLRHHELHTPRAGSVPDRKSVAEGKSVD